MRYREPVNPVSGNRDEMIVNSGFGLGEAIVGGEITPEFALELGSRLKQAGIFTRDDDVYYLQRRELKEAIRARYEDRAAPESYRVLSYRNPPASG